MPNWKIHLEVGKRLNQKIQYSKNDFELFLLGNILPDINNCYIVKNISKVLEHDYTHFKDMQDITYIAFYNKYKNKINDNLVIKGYFTHLYTDYIWNNNFYCKIQNTKLDKMSKDEKRLLKQKEFQIYNNKYMSNYIKLGDYEDVLAKLNAIDRVSITKEDLSAIIYFLKNQSNNTSDKLSFYTTEELDELLEETVIKISQFLDI